MAVDPWHDISTNENILWALSHKTLIHLEIQIVNFKSYCDLKFTSMSLLEFLILKNQKVKDETLIDISNNCLELKSIQIRCKCILNFMFILYIASD